MAFDSRHIALKAYHITFEARHINLKARHITFENRYINLKLRHIALDDRHVALERRHIVFDDRHVHLQSPQPAIHALNVTFYALEVAPDVPNIRPEHPQQAQKKGDCDQKGYPLDGQDCDESRIHCVFLLAKLERTTTPG